MYDSETAIFETILKLALKDFLLNYIIHKGLILDKVQTYLKIIMNKDFKQNLLNMNDK